MATGCRGESRPAISAHQAPQAGSYFFFFLAAFFVVFFAPLALRFFAMHVTSFLFEILQHRCKVSKEISPHKRPAKVVASRTVITTRAVAGSDQHQHQASRGLFVPCSP